MRAIPIFLALALAGCAGVEAGNERGGVLRAPPLAMQSALNAADEHCARYGKTAEVGGSVGLATANRITFVCR